VSDLSLASLRAGRAWSYALASAVGSSHGRSGTPCQDASSCELVERADGTYVVATVSDGAGSARLSQIGSRLACQIVSDEARKFLASGAPLVDFDRPLALVLLDHLQAVIARTARRADLRPRDFACTLLFAVVGPESAVFAQIGDGAIVAAPGAPTPTPRGSGYDWVFWPQRGEYANETHFATEADADEHLYFEHWPHPIRELALLSDGLQNMVLDLRAKTAHARFFAPMFATMATVGPGRSASLSAALERYLLSPTVQRRTDDDTSLILVRRHQPEPPPALPAPSAPAPAAVEERV
jgi:protein phosphatase 2C-like protein